MKNGKQRNGTQRWICILCRASQQSDYKSNAYKKCINAQIAQLLKEGCGIRSTSRVLSISINTVTKRIRTIASKIKKPAYNHINNTFELDEMKTFIGNKKYECWIIYALCRKTKQVIDFVTGRRTKENLEKVVNTVFLTNPRKICTDELSGLCILPCGLEGFIAFYAFQVIHDLQI